MIKQCHRPPAFWLRCFLAVCLYGAFWWCVTRAVLPVPAGSAVAQIEGETVPEPAFSAEPEVPAPPPRPVILIDPGHGGTDPGTSANDEYEKNWTLDVALQVESELKKLGHPVELTRRTDEKIRVEDRCNMANSRPRLAFVSIHFNADGNSAESRGIETLYSWPRKPDVMLRLQSELKIPSASTFVDDRSRLLADHIQRGLIAATGARDRGVKNRADTPREDLAVTSRTVMPAVLVECGFLSNAEECARIRDKDYRKKLVAGIVGGIDAWLAESGSPGYGIRITDAPPPQ